MQKKVRIKDVAAKAGVSTGTVDRVLHNRGYVSEEVRRKVLLILDEIGYERNLLASTLAYNRDRRIVALLPDHAADPYWEQPYTGTQQALASLQHYGIRVEYLLFNLFDPEDFLAKGAQLLEHPPDGLLFPPLFLKEGKWLIENCAAAGIPVVIINTQIEGANVLSYIGQDSYQSGVLAARLLDFALNDGETVMVLNLEKSITNAIHILEKERGFRDYFARHQGVEVVRHDFEDFPDKNHLKQFFTEQLAAKSNLAGVFVSNSRAYHLVDCLPENAGRQIKIVGFDLVKSNIDYLNAGKINFLVNQNSVEQGYLGIVTLFKYLFLKETPPRNQYLPLDIVVAENLQYYLNKQQSLHVF